MRYAKPDWARSIEAALGEGPAAERPLVAVSGGPDSLALLVMMAQARSGRFSAATVDHGLRPAAASEAAMVAAFCAERGVPHAVLRPAQPIAPKPLAALEKGHVLGVVNGDVRGVALPSTDGGSLLARARSARYDALVDHARGSGCDLLLTAHHRDDQAETFLMRASRGGGVDGLAGVRRLGEWRGFPLFRPVLDWSRSRLGQVVAEAGLAPADDPTNDDPAFDRTRFRRMLAAFPDLGPEGLIRSAAALADASEALTWVVERLAHDRIVSVDADLVIDTASLPRELRRRLLVLALRRRGVLSPRGPTLDLVLDDLAEGRRAAVGGLLIARLADDRWRVTSAPPNRRR